MFIYFFSDDIKWCTVCIMKQFSELAKYGENEEKVKELFWEGFWAQHLEFLQFSLEFDENNTFWGVEIYV